MWGAGLAAPQAQGEHMDGRWQRQVRCLRRAGRRRLWTLDGRARSRSIRGVELSIDDATTAHSLGTGKAIEPRRATRHGGQTGSNSAFGRCLSVLHHLRGGFPLPNMILSHRTGQLQRMAGCPASSFVHTVASFFFLNIVQTN